MASNTSENAGRPQTHRMDRFTAGCKTLSRPLSRARASPRPRIHPWWLTLPLQAQLRAEPDGRVGTKVRPRRFALYKPCDVLAKCGIPNPVMRPSQRTTEASRVIARKPRSFPYLMDLQCHSHKRRPLRDPS